MANEQRANGISAAFAKISDDRACDYVRRYYGLNNDHQGPFTGAHFDGLPTVAANRITAEDIIAVSCLSVHVPAAAAVEILGGQTEEISALLSRIPISNLEELPIDQHEELFGAGSAASDFWLLLRKHVGVGPTTASKLMARKRPGLIPIYDSVVARVTGFDSSADTWRAWHNAFSTDGALQDRLGRLRDSVGLERVSLLRILDVVLWMDGKGFVERERVDVVEAG
ncbi:DUF6308 family protein [Pseudarthrobacter enclensis]|uniref:DUF6308 family protein n=1 Tax=Pseudarthrobacter enclensis TaxID=993070 RepID=UPI00368D0C26